MKSLPLGASKAPIKFRMPTAENLIPIRLDIEIDGQRYKDAFTWNPNDPDSEVVSFAKRTVKDLKLPPTFMTQIAQSIQDVSNFETDPEEFARTLCEDLNIEDPEVGPAIAVAIREQLYEVATQSVSSARETRVGKKGRRGIENVTNSKTGNSALDLLKLFGNKGSVIRKRKEWYLYEPIVDILSNEEVGALDAREELNARLKKKLDEKEDSFQTRYSHG
ncbi:chromatin structure-remodeling complex protein BSH isoform X3 [Elaeis guineensis]|uniref:chromatin structure-remodeling complex protein BSH isoform X3 n=1 Tax=Elaeis guineensis var. tenera TaxID=51953 RepID=UPI003C6DAAC6